MMQKQAEPKSLQPEEVITRIRSTMCWHFQVFSVELFDVRAKDINDEMKIAAAEALAGLITDEELSPDYIIPKAFDKRVGPAVAKAVAEAAKKTGVVTSLRFC